MKTLSKTASFFTLLKQALRGEDLNFTEGSINRAIFLLAVPMILEMSMESVFAVVDIYFVTKLHSSAAVSAVGLTESMLTIVYSIAIGVSMSATAMVARRIGEKDNDGAAIAAVQSIYIGLMTATVISIGGLIFYKDLLKWMGASDELMSQGSGYTRLMLGGNFTVILLFLINAIFRGAGNAAVAMRSLILSNLVNIALDPIFIFGLGPIDSFGVEGAAIATNIGRGIGVVYQLYYLMGKKGIIKFKKEHLKIDWGIIGKLLKVSLGSIGQFFISSASWIFLINIMTKFGDAAVAGYTIATRAMIFTLLPSWGMANAAATLVGQNLGAKQPERAGQSVWKAGFSNMVFLGVVSVIFIFAAVPILKIFSSNPEEIRYGSECLQIIAYGYILYGYGMVVVQSLNGAGDTLTPTVLNFIAFWMLQIPLAWFLALKLGYGPTGVFIAFVVAESAMAIAAIVIFRRGKWKTIKI
jgi:putative MATE family efflux protein